MRSTSGRGSSTRRCPKPRLNGHRLFHDLIGDFDAEALARRQASPLEAAGLDAPG